MKKLFTSLVLCCTSLLALAQFPDALAEELQMILNNRVQFSGDNGVAACVILPNGDEWSGQAGIDGSGQAITDSTVFHGASCTKTHVTTCMMMLAQEGLVNLDAAWSEYVDLNVSFDPDITIRQLLNNTSGIADYLEIPGVGQTIMADPAYFWAPTEILEDVISQIPDFPAGTDFHYASTNFVLAGLVIEEVSGNSLFTELKNRIWEPLGLDHTYGGAYDEYTEPRAGVWWNFGGGLMNHSDESEISMLSFAHGGAGMVSTPIDQAHFIHPLLGGELLADTSLAQMHEFIPESYDDWSAGYGMGIHHAINVGGDDVIGVDGYYTNMSSTFHSHTDGFSIATMTNTQTDWYGIFGSIFNSVKNYMATSVAEVGEEVFIRCYPQPATDFVWIDGMTTLGSKVIVYNQVGQHFDCGVQRSDNRIRVDLTELSSGIYVVLVEVIGQSPRFIKVLKS